MPNKAKSHLFLTLGFWGGWLLAVYNGSRYLAGFGPNLGDVLGVLGTLVLFLPSATILAWDVVTRTGEMPNTKEGFFGANSEGYDPFTWGKLLLNILGITLIGLGFAINYWIKAGLP